MGRQGVCATMLPSYQVEVDGAEALELDTRKVRRYARRVTPEEVGDKE